MPSHDFEKIIERMREAADTAHREATVLSEETYRKLAQDEQRISDLRHLADQYEAAAHVLDRASRHSATTEVSE